MLRHGDIWMAIDHFARAHGLSPSGLARRAGLDSTTFNKSKRTSREGKLRWPSTESISKILAAMDCSFGDFLIYLGGDAAEGLGQRVPVIGFAEAGDQGFFDDQCTDQRSHCSVLGMNDIWLKSMNFLS